MTIRLPELLFLCNLDILFDMINDNACDPGVRYQSLCTLASIVSNASGINLRPEALVNAVETRAWCSGSLGSYAMWQVFPYVSFDTRVRTKWSR